MTELVAKVYVGYAFVLITYYHVCCHLPWANVIASRFFLPAGKTEDLLGFILMCLSALAQRLTACHGRLI